MSLLAAVSVLLFSALGGGLPTAKPEPETKTKAKATSEALAPAAMVSSKAEFHALATYLEARLALQNAGDRAALLTLDSETAEHALPGVRARASFEVMRSVVRGGDMSGGRKRAAALGLANTAWMIGPFAHTGATQLLEPTPPEQDFLVSFAAEPALEQPWQRVLAEPREGILDVGAHLSSTREVRAILLAVAVLEEAGDYALRLGSSAQVVAAVNGETLFARDVHRRLGWDQEEVAVHLKQGPNLILLRLGNVSGPLRVRMRLTALDGSAIAGLRWSASERERSLAVSNSALKAAQSGLVSVERALAAFVAAPPLHRALVPGQPDALYDAIVVEQDRQRYDQRQHPVPHELWRLALLLRYRTEVATDVRQQRLASTLTKIGDALADKNATLARRRYQKALLEVPDFVPAWSGLARLRMAQDLVLEAISLWQRVLSHAGQDDAALTEAWDGLRLQGWRTLETDQALLRRAPHSTHAPLLRLAADVAEERGDLALARTFAHRLQTWDEADQVAHRMLQAGFFALPNLGPTTKVASANRTDEGGLKAAIAYQRVMLLHWPHAHRLARDLTFLYEAAGQNLEADALIKERQQSYPALSTPWALKAEVETWRGRRELARLALTQALLRSPQNRDLRTMLRTLTPAADDFASRFALDPNDYRDRPLPSGAAEVGAHIAQRQIAARFFENGLGTIVEDKIIAIHDARKAAGFSVLRFPSAEGREVVEVLRAFILRADGTRVPAHAIYSERPAGKVDGVYTDLREEVVDFGQLVAGDLLWVKTRKDLVGRQSLFGKFFGLLEPLQAGVPTAQFTLIVQTPKTRPLSIGGRGVPPADVTASEHHLLYRIERENLPRLSLEESMPPILERSDYVSVSSVARWSDLGQWYKKLIANSLFADEALKKVAREKTMGATSVSDKVRLLYTYVVHHTRYVGIELGIHGWRPYPVTEVHRRRYGDCKDKASLLITLLHEVGVKARIVLVRTADLGLLEDKPPSMWAFNHAIAYVPALDLYLDPTAEFSNWRELPALDQGAMGLTVAPFEDVVATLVRLPLAGAMRNSNDAAYQIDVLADGGLSMVGEERFTGVRAAGQRAALADVAHRRATVEQSLSSGLPGLKIHALSAVGETIASEVVGYDYRASLPSRSQASSAGTWTLPLSLFPQQLASGWARRSERKTDVWLQYPWRTHNVMVYRLPAGWSVKELPVGGDVISPHLIFKQRVELTSTGFVVEEETIFPSRQIPVADYLEFRKAAAAADDIMQQNVLLVPAGQDS